jgi:hypothetical protein
MKIVRSSKCPLKFATEAKRVRLREVLAEYGLTVNAFIEWFWEHCPSKDELLKPLVDSLESWLSARLRKVAAREAIDIVLSARRRDGQEAHKPMHKGRRMCISSTIGRFEQPRSATEFDAWLLVRCIGRKLALDLPLRLHRHFHRLAAKGKRLNAYIATESSVQFSFEIETGPKPAPERCIGIDTGLRALASLSSGEQLGTDIGQHLKRVKRCRHGSLGQRRARRALRQRIDEVARDSVQRGTLVVVEKLRGITKNRKRDVRRRLTRTMRRFIGSWNVRYRQRRLEEQGEWNRVSFRTVPAFYTSQMCPACAQVDGRNRDGARFLCQCSAVQRRPSSRPAPRPSSPGGSTRPRPSSRAAWIELFEDRLGPLALVPGRKLVQDGRELLGPGPRQLVRGLQVGPQLGAGAQGSREQPGCRGRHGTLAADDLVEALQRNAQVLGKGLLGHAQGLEELFQQHLPRMGRSAMGREHVACPLFLWRAPGLVVIHHSHVMRIRTHPPEDDAPLVVDPDAVVSGQAAPESFEPVPRRHPQVLEPLRTVDQVQLSTCRCDDVLRISGQEPPLASAPRASM